VKTVFYHENKAKWHIIDAKDNVLGKVASLAASLLRGKYNVTYTPHIVMGDHVIIINARRAFLTGRKYNNKLYWKHSGYPGGIRSESYKGILAKKPTFPMEHAVKGMLPKNKLGRALFRNLYVYADANHLHIAQKPVERNNLLQTRKQS